MKSIFKYLVFSFLFINLTGCSYLDVVPDNVTVLDNAFSNRYTAEQYLSTCYWHIPYGDWNQNPAMLGSAEAIFNNDKSAQGTVIAKGNNSAASPAINHWSGTNGARCVYNGIRDCNIFLENIGKVRDLSDLENRQWSAEIKVLKAYFHFYLLRYYGPIHIIRENLPVYEELSKVQLYRDPVDDCFAYILQLLEEAINSKALPGIIQNTQKELGRITLPAAMALKARVLMYWASPLFNGNTDYEAFKNHQGKHFFNQVYDPDRWVQAAQACEEAIRTCNENGIRLYQTQDYKTQYAISDSTILNCVLRNSYSERWNPEVIWGNTNIIVDATQRVAQAGLRAVTSSIIYSYYAVSINTAEQFYSDKGVPMEEDLTYDYSNRYKLKTAGEKDKYYIEKGQQTAAMNFDREPRFYAFLGFDRGKWYGRGKLENDAETWHVEGKLKEYSAAYEPGNYSATGYWPKKVVSLKSGYESVSEYRVETYPFPELRYTDLLLYYAEALNEMKETPDAAVYDPIDQVRKRAGLKGVLESWTKYSKYPGKPTTKAGMREIIHKERLIELAFENAHYWDVRRWKEAISSLNRPIKAWNVLSDNNADYYTIKVYFEQKFSQRDYLAPIPESELIKNPLLIQNPGW